MKKRALSLIEIMIVIFIITLVTGAIGYNMKGTLDKGRVFRTEQAQEQLYDLLHVCADDGVTMEALADDPIQYLKKSNIAKNPKKLVEDGWGKEFTITVEDDDFVIVSERLEAYKSKNQSD